MGFIKDFLDAHDPNDWYQKGHNDAMRGKKRFELFVPFGSKRIEVAYNKGYDDALNNQVNAEYCRELSTFEKIAQALKNINEG